MTHEWPDGPPTATVLQAVADAEDCEPEDLPPLYETIDPDALQKVLDVEAASEPRRVEFVYASYEVTVTADGAVDVTSR